MGELAKMMMGGEASGDYVYYKRDVTIGREDYVQGITSYYFAGTRCWFSDSCAINEDGTSISTNQSSSFAFPDNANHCSDCMNTLIGKYFSLSGRTGIWRGFSAHGDQQSENYTLDCDVIRATLGPKKYYVENENKHSTYNYKDGVMTAPVV